MRKRLLVLLLTGVLLGLSACGNADTDEDEYYYYHPTVNGMDAEACFGPLHIL